MGMKKNTLITTTNMMTSGRIVITLIYKLKYYRSRQVTQMDYYVFWYGLVPVASLIGLLVVLFVVMKVISTGKHKRIMNELNSARPGDVRGNAKLGFYPSEDKGSFGKESFKMTFEDDGAVDMSAFTLSATEREQRPQELVVEHQGQTAQVKDFNAVSNNMVGYQQQGAAPPMAGAPPSAPRMPPQPPPVQQPAQPMQPGFPQAPQQVPMQQGFAQAPQQVSMQQGLPQQQQPASPPPMQPGTMPPPR